MDSSTKAKGRIAIPSRLFLLTIVLTSCSHEESTSANTPAKDNDGRQSSSPQTPSHDSAELLALRERLEETPPENLEETCTAIIESDSSSIEMVRLALIKRIRYFDDSRLPKKAALDVFDYWRRADEGKVEERPDPFLLGVVNRAGFLLEAELLERTRHRRLHSARLYQEFRVEEEPRVLASTMYFDGAPDTRWLRQEPLQAGTASIARALYFARAARLCLYRQTEPRALHFINGFIENGGTLLVDGATTREELVLLEDLSDLLLAHISRGREDGGPDFAPWTYGSSESAGTAVDATPELATMLLDVFVARIQAEKESGIREPKYEVLNDLVDRFIDIGYPRLAEQTCTRYLDILPDSESRFQIGMRLASLYDDTLNAPEAAIEVYLALAKDDRADSFQASAARLKASSVLIKGKHFERGYLELQELTSENTNPALLPNAEYLSAVCEFHLGAIEQAKKRMLDIVQRFPDSSTSAAALLWIGRHYLHAQDYTKARMYIEDLLLKYPSSSQANLAQSLQSQLESLED